MHKLLLITTYLTFLSVVYARCDCTYRAFIGTGCDSISNLECLCSSSYLSTLEACFAEDNCSPEDQQSMTDYYNGGCASLDSRQNDIEVLDTSLSSLELTSVESSSSTESSSTTETPTATETPITTITTTTATSEPNTSGIADGNEITKEVRSGKTGLSKAAIGGIVGGSIFAVLATIFSVLCCIGLKGKKKEEVNVEANKQEIDSFIFEGFKTRTASGNFSPRPLSSVVLASDGPLPPLQHAPDWVSTKRHSTLPALSHPLGEYSSADYYSDDEHNLSPGDSITNQTLGPGDSISNVGVPDDTNYQQGQGYGDVGDRTSPQTTYLASGSQYR